MKRLVLLLVLLALASGFLFAGAGQETAMAEKIELRYMMWDPQIIEKEQELADKYQQENPNVTITVESAAFAQFWEKMQAMAVSSFIILLFCWQEYFRRLYLPCRDLLNILRIILISEVSGNG